jgi:hypothetical protein
MMVKKIFRTKPVIIIFAAFFITLVCVLLISLWKSSRKPPTVVTGETFNNLPVDRIRGTFLIDVDNPNEMVGGADYVFAAKVISEDGYVYKDYITKEIEGGGVENIGDPYTNYSVDIVENIKGDLITDETIPIQKYGGLYEDGSGYTLFEGDEFPLVGETYIFYVYVEADGTLLVGGPNSNQKIETPDHAKTAELEEIIADSDEVEIVEDALDTQVEISKRKRFKSLYEEGTP